MKLKSVVCFFVSMIIICCLTACSIGYDNGSMPPINDNSDGSHPQFTETEENHFQPTEEGEIASVSAAAQEDSGNEASDNYTAETVGSNSDELRYEASEEIDDYGIYTLSEIMHHKEQREIFDLVLPNDVINIDELSNYSVIKIILTEKADLSFLAELSQLKELYIYNGEEDAVPEPSDESYVEFYDFLNCLNNLEYLRISREPHFNTEYLNDLNSLKYLHFYATNVDLAGYYPNIKELSIGGGSLSSYDLYNFFPNLVCLETYAVNLNLESVAKMDKLEFLHLSMGQSNDSIEALANNKNLKSFILATRSEPLPNDEFILELTDLRYFWCYEGMFSEETISRFMELNPECEVFDKGQW